jgi:hypothetical protein
MDPANSPATSESLAPSSLQAWQLADVSHGFMSRTGGVSRGAFATLNLAGWIGDDPQAVAENWRRWNTAYPAMTPACLNQVHGNQVRILDQAYDGSRPPGDGMVTRAPGIALCIFTADCVPVLLVDPINRVAGALHAGWRGALADIAAVGVRAMIALGAQPGSIRAALGPSIGVCCFEVDSDLAKRFADEVPDAREHTRPGRTGKVYLDLRAIVQDQLSAAGVGQPRLTKVGPCTKCANDRYFSRRANGGALSGLQMSFIGFKT